MPVILFLHGPKAVERKHFDLPLLAQCQSTDPTLAMYEVQSCIKAIGSLPKENLLVWHFHCKLHVHILGHDCTSLSGHMNTHNFRYVQGESDRNLEAKIWS